MISGFDYRALREERRLKRPEVAEISGLSIATIARIETTGKIKPAEHAALRKVFTAEDQQPTQSSIEGAPKLIDGSPGAMHRRVREWNGLVSGDSCLVTGTHRSRWEFVAHCTSPEGSEYIEVKGGKPGHVLLRAFVPERVKAKPAKKKRRRQTEDS